MIDFLISNSSNRLSSMAWAILRKDQLFSQCQPVSCRQCPVIFAMEAFFFVLNTYLGITPEVVGLWSAVSVG
jgi:hypothetical protein